MCVSEEQTSLIEGSTNLNGLRNANVTEWHVIYYINIHCHAVLVYRSEIRIDAHFMFKKLYYYPVAEISDTWPFSYSSFSNIISDMKVARSATVRGPPRPVHEIQLDEEADEHVGQKGAGGLGERCAGFAVSVTVSLASPPCWLASDHYECISVLSSYPSCTISRKRK